MHWASGTDEEPRAVEGGKPKKECHQEYRDVCKQATQWTRFLQKEQNIWKNSISMTSTTFYADAILFDLQIKVKRKWKDKWNKT